MKNPNFPINKDTGKEKICFYIYILYTYYYFLYIIIKPGFKITKSTNYEAVFY